MKTQDLTFTLIVDQTPEVVFNAVNNVRGWWSETLEGDSEKLNDEFIYRYQDMHYSKQRLVEVVPNQKVVWLVLDSYLSFIEDKTEWTGTKISFEITREQDKTQLLFTHHGLNPEVECYNACFDGWSHYIKGSLVELIAKGEKVSSN
ncbi:MAG: SRPBCC domain-containing protein [Bacteroidetes bacterium]|nr:MAG: SRPBCC domain-containing protein [Bacteroidota bacterium]